ncbi:hypothetical protein BJ138DRAFT_1118245 [Hygrophoropsis aurantiaca]|uniref:Uncharacterized protein n=1 Tax=Hygrophoropsis aurantiaca TaxID=72124 RepID=A0ACB7ZY84_9AGAM|nr:hypothetical protein BJ138DRAFT_1118245 [Hygrophoropsis aurantiaca]
MNTTSLTTLARDFGDRWTPHFRPMSTYYWVCLNGDSVEGRDLSTGLTSYRRLTSGEFADRDWALHARWYDSKKAWEGFIPQPAQPVLTGLHRWVWLGRAEPSHWTEGSGGMVRLRPAFIASVRGTYEVLGHLLHQVQGLYSQGGAINLRLADIQWLNSEFALPELAAPRIWDLRRNVVDVLGFVSWHLLRDEAGWQTRPWDPTFVDKVLDMRFLECPKRGVHIKTSEADMGLLAQWIRHSVPVHYIWDPHLTGPWCPIELGARNLHSYNHLVGEEPPAAKKKQKTVVWSGQTMQLGESSAKGQNQAPLKTAEYDSQLYSHPSGCIHVLSSNYEPEEEDSSVGPPTTSAILARWASKQTLLKDCVGLDRSYPMDSDDDDDMLGPNVRSLTASSRQTPVMKSSDSNIPARSTGGLAQTGPILSTTTHVGAQERTTTDNTIIVSTFDDSDGMNTDPSRTTANWTASPVDEEIDHGQGWGLEEEVLVPNDVSYSSSSVPTSAVSSSFSSSGSLLPRSEQERGRQSDRGGHSSSRSIGHRERSLPQANGKRQRRDDSRSPSRRPRYHDVWRPGPRHTERRSLSPSLRTNRGRKDSFSATQPRRRRSSFSPPPRRHARDQRSPLRLYYDDWEPTCQGISPIRVVDHRGGHGIKLSLAERLASPRASSSSISPSTGPAAQGLLQRLRDAPQGGVDIASWIRSKFTTWAETFLPAASSLPPGLIPTSFTSKPLRAGHLDLPPTTAVRCHVLLAESPELEPTDLPSLCLARGMPFRIWVPVGGLKQLMPSGLSGGRSKPAYLTAAEAGFSAKGPAEACAEYLLRASTLMMRPHARRFLTMGGLLWRIALEFGPPGLYQAALAGPSIDTTFYNAGEYLPATGETDDTVSDEEVDVLLGGYDGPGYRQRLSLWPPLKMLTDSGRWTGEWTETNETWFAGRVALIRAKSLLAFQSYKTWKQAVKALSAATLANEETVNTVAHTTAVLRDSETMSTSRLELPSL